MNSNKINLAGFSGSNNGGNNNGGDLTPEMILNNAFNSNSGMNMNGGNNNNKQSKTVDHNLYLAGQHLGFIKLHKYLNPQDAQLVLNNIIAGVNGQAVFELRLCGSDVDKRLDLSSLGGFGSNNPQPQTAPVNTPVSNEPTEAQIQAYLAKQAQDMANAKSEVADTDVSGVTLSVNTENQQA